MLSEAQARELLQAAGDTIEVEPAQPLPILDRPKIWPMLVAAAAVVAIVATTLAVADRGTTPPPPSTPPSPTPTLDADQIPPVMGLDPDAARALLTERGLDVRVASHWACPGNVAMGSRPAVGTRFEPGDVVVLTVMEAPQGAACTLPGIRGWGLLRFALGVAAPPRFADEVTLHAGDADPVTLSADEAKDPASWEVCDGDLCGSALSVLAAAATAPAQTGVGPILQVWDQPRGLIGPPLCGLRDIETGGMAYLGITIEPPTDGVSLCPQVTAFYSRTGLLEAVAIPLAPDDEPEPRPSEHAAAAADQLVGWARGSSAPPAFADEVRYLLNDGVIRKMSGTNATQQERWKVCFSGVPLGCPSPLDTLDNYEGVVVQTSSPAVSCVSRRAARLPDDLASLELVRLDQPEAKDCWDAWAIEVWVDAAGRITAINQLPGTAAPPAQ